MGLKRKITARVEFIMPFDDSVKGGYQEYLEDFDRSKLTLEGEPTVFAIEPATYAQKSLIDREADGRDKRVVAVRCMLRDVKGYVIEDANGQTSTLPRPTTVALEPWGTLIDEKWMIESDLSDHEIDMISAVGRRISNLAPL